MPFAIGLLIGAQLLGEVLRRLLGLPLPGPVIGMFVLATCLAVRHAGRQGIRADPSPLVRTASALVSNMGLLFVPAGVGIVAEANVLRQAWLPILVGLVASTMLGLIVTGLVMHRLSTTSAVRPSSDDEGQEVA